jgi:hypothetical protein
MRSRARGVGKKVQMIGLEKSMTLIHRRIAWRITKRLISRADQE